MGVALPPLVRLSDTPPLARLHGSDGNFFTRRLTYCILSSSSRITHHYLLGVVNGGGGNTRENPYILPQAAGWTMELSLLLPYVPVNTLCKLVIAYQNPHL
jgi:hypothetical protein